MLETQVALEGATADRFFERRVSRFLGKAGAVGDRCLVPAHLTRVQHTRALPDVLVEFRALGLRPRYSCPGGGDRSAKSLRRRLLSLRSFVAAVRERH